MSAVSVGGPVTVATFPYNAAHSMNGHKGKWHLALRNYHSLEAAKRGTQAWAGEDIGDPAEQGH